MAEKDSERYVFSASVVVEVLGAPQKHVEEAMKVILKKLKDEKDIKLVGGKVHKPKPVGKFFTLYADLNLKFVRFEDLTSFCFDYMPSSIEINEPGEFKVQANEFSGFVNDLMAKLHAVDMKLKGLSARSQIIDKNALALMKNAVLLSLKGGPKDVASISKDLGIQPGQLKPFLENFLKEGHFVKKQNKYVLKKK